MRRVLVLTDDRISGTMAGPAIRAWEIAHQLAKVAQVTLASTQPVERESPHSQVSLLRLTPREVFHVAQRHDALFIGGLMLAQNPSLMHLDMPIILDVYDPLLFEELGSHQGRLGLFIYHQHHALLAKQLRRADFMVCASERQRDYWIGRLCALGRLDPDTYAEDPSFRGLIDCVPFGISSTLPVTYPPRLRGKLVGMDDCVMLWGGGLWDWLDPLTPIRAAEKLVDSHSMLKLVFLAGRSPNPGTPIMPMVEKAKTLAASLGVLGRNVFFYDQWIPYSERGSLLLEADAGFIGHPDWIETRFAFRTRVLDYLWAELPVISTCGDSFSQWIEQHHWGSVCAFADVDDWVKAFQQMLDPEYRKLCRQNIQVSRNRFCWEQAVLPLIRYLEHPIRGKRAFQNHFWHEEPWASLSKASLSLVEEGPGPLFNRIRRVFHRHV